MKYYIALLIAFLTFLAGLTAMWIGSVPGAGWIVVFSLFLLTVSLDKLWDQEETN